MNKHSKLDVFIYLSQYIYLSSNHLGSVK